jgi:hypothetical protein
MSSAYDNLARILGATTSQEQRLAAIRGFATELHWTPSFELHSPVADTGADDHLIVEHGLQNSAIISFIKTPRRTMDLDPFQLRSLLSISFNNLVEWHIFVSESEVRYINNLTEPYFDKTFSISRASTEFVSAEKFDYVAETVFSESGTRRTLQACDDALIQVIARWKRLLKADYRRLTNDQISALFNSIIFSRACEDQKKSSDDVIPSRLLLTTLDETQNGPVHFVSLITESLARCGTQMPQDVLDIRALQKLPRIERLTAQQLLADFYRPSFAAYDFDFALMSKHALSRIYERYVALLEFEEGARKQLSFLPEIPQERSAVKSGSVYTPLFVASFFARFLRDNLTPKAFRGLQTIDPACGSGIFPRTILELQCNPLVPGTTTQTIAAAFKNAYAIDRDPNASQATKLSLALLHLVATGTLPQKLNVLTANAIELALDDDLPLENAGAVLANPPYVKLDHLSSKDRKTYSTYLADEKTGRPDSYLAFMKLCFDLANEGGFVCLVLPQVFLLANNAAPLRRRISSDFDVRCLIDLSAVTVFEDVGAYSILLILQKRNGSLAASPYAHIARIQGLAGQALQAVLEGKSIMTDYYQVFDIQQDFFERDEWTLLRPAEIELERKLAKFKSLSNYLAVHQGFVTGADDIFIRPKPLVPQGEEQIYINYLPDRDIGRYSVPKTLQQVVFYPFEKGRPLSESSLKTNYPKTWAYLKSHRTKLAARKAVTSGDTPWWRPVRPREPSHMLSSKIVCPHLMLTPRFALDLNGRLAVSRSPFLIPREENSDDSFLKFFCAVLNSPMAHWFITSHAPKYSRGYNRIEVPVLKSVPVPDPAQIPPGTLKEIIRLVDAVSGRNGTETTDRLDDIVISLYGLSSDEKEALQGPR